MIPCYSVQRRQYTGYKLEFQVREDWPFGTHVVFVVAGVVDELFIKVDKAVSYHIDYSLNTEVSVRARSEGVLPFEQTVTITHPHQVVTALGIIDIIFNGEVTAEPLLNSWMADFFNVDRARLPRYTKRGEKIDEKKLKWLKPY